MGSTGLIIREVPSTYVDQATVYPENMGGFTESVHAEARILRSIKPGRPLLASYTTHHNLLSNSLGQPNV
jgi:hypothetical protein